MMGIAEPVITSRAQLRSSSLRERNCARLRARVRSTYPANCFKSSSRVASFKRVPQNCGNLFIQHFKTAAKLELLVRYDALNRDLNDNRQYVTDECCRQNRGDQRSKVRSHVPNKKTCDSGRNPDDDLEKCFHSKCSRRSLCRPLPIALPPIGRWSAHQQSISGYAVPVTKATFRRNNLGKGRQKRLR
jgi:hypothetical protein